MCMSASIMQEKLKKAKKRKVTLHIDEDVWDKFLKHLIWRYSHQREASKTVQALIERFLQEGQQEDKSASTSSR